MLINAVAPFAGAWIEIASVRLVVAVISSLPSRERGLKLPYMAQWLPIQMSLPSRERGLKSLQHNEGMPRTVVAPFAGAWIEMTK